MAVLSLCAIRADCSSLKADFQPIPLVPLFICYTFPFFFLSSVQAKASGKKLQKVTLKVSPRGIILYDSASNQLMENISIYRLVVPFDFLIYASPMTMPLAEYCPRLVSSP